MSSRPTCSHLDQIVITDAPTREQVAGCEQCLKSAGQWVHLRICRTCGEVGCCDSSPSRHASAHAREHSHPIVTSIEPGESWSWCFEDQVAFVLD